MKKSEVAQVYMGADEKSWQELLDDLRPQGKWICDYRTCTCSVCSFTTVIDIYNFCPDCGADMRGKQK